MKCMILSPNCCAVTIFEYSSADVTLLPSCLSVGSEHITSQSKWQSADLDLIKLAKKRKSLIELCRKCTARLKVNQKHKVTTIEQEFKYRKRMAFSVLSTLISVQLHLMLAVNNLGLKFVS